MKYFLIIPYWLCTASLTSLAQAAAVSLGAS